MLLLDQMASKGYHSHYTNTGCSVNGEILLHQSPTPRLGETTCTVPLTGYEPRAILYMSDNSIPQQFERRCGIQDRGVEVVGIGKGNGAHATRMLKISLILLWGRVRWPSILWNIALQLGMVSATKRPTETGTLRSCSPCQRYTSAVMSCNLNPQGRAYSAAS